MSSTAADFLNLLETMGSTVVFHREEGGTLCPCLSPEGFRSPAWHKAHPLEPVCNEKGVLAATVTDLTVKASVQPVRRKMRIERVVELFGQVETGDHLGIFPAYWNGTYLDFAEWSDAGEDYVLYDNRRFIVVDAEKFADIDGNPNHHWEVALRLVSNTRVV